ncbi:MAG: hypothetical protein Ct9H90mP22_0500 [Gammaproteobacteria bacterium]|nr:MAG: hypothetical protein Ct9H90mP22_0500 [Gammaproteobacteria bacterium]
MDSCRLRKTVINIMKKEQREFYDLEGLWGEMNLTDALS